MVAAMKREGPEREEDSGDDFGNGMGLGLCLIFVFFTISFGSV